MVTTFEQNLKENSGLSDNNNAMRLTQCVGKGENTERINNLSNNEDCNVAQNNAIDNDNNLQGAPTGKIGICKHCGKPFEKRTTWHIFCEEQCRLDHHGVYDLNGLKRNKRKR
jgi:hypothetical protein